MDTFRRIRRWSIGASLVCLLIAACALLGWTFDIDILRSPAGQLSAMNPTSAVCLMLLSLAVLSCHLPNASHRLTLTLAALPGIICICRIVISDTSGFQVDELLFSDRLGVEQVNGFAARMARSTAWCVVGVSVSILLARASKFKMHAQYMTIVTGFIAWLSVLGYIYSVPEYDGLAPYFPMAIHTALSLVLLSSAVFALHPQAGLAADLFSPLRGGRDARWLLPVVIAGPLALGYLRLWSHWLGLVSVEFGIALLTLMVTVLVSTVIIAHIRSLNRGHHQQLKYDAEARKLNTELVASNQEVKRLVSQVTASNEELRSANEQLARVNKQLQEASDKIREQTETILRQKDEQLDRTVEATDVVIWSIDLTGGERHFLSKTFERVTGIPVNDFLHTPVESWTRVLLPEDIPVRDRALAELLEKGSSRAVLRARNKEGKVRYFDVQQVIVRDAQGIAVRQEGVGMDITFVKESEISLTAERKLLRLLIDNIPDFIFVKDEQLRHIINNKANVELLGARTEEETLGKTVVDYLGESGRALIEDDKEVLRTGQPIINRQEYIPDAQGKIRTLLTTKVPLRDEQGNINRIVGISRDITDVIRKDNEITRYRENLEIIFSNTMEEIYLLDNQGRLVLFNQAADTFITSATGKPLAPGKFIWEATLPGRRQVSHELFRRALAGEDVIHEARIELPTGVVYREVHYEPVVKDGEVKYISLISLDVTAKKEREMLREKTEEEKNILVEQLINQNNDLLQFSFIASHNLRGPVASVLGLLNLIKGQDMSEQTTIMVNMLRQSAYRLEAVIKDLSDILEIRSSQTHAKEVVQIAQEVGTVQIELQQQVSESKAAINLEVGEVTSFYTIRTYLHSILYNLISNAIKYRAKSRPLVITVKTFATPTGKGFIVSDNGSGIDLDQFGDKIFGMYQRFHLEVEGKGIGLYMVKTQVQSLNGAISIESKPNVGTSFTITFPPES